MTKFKLGFFMVAVLAFATSASYAGVTFLPADNSSVGRSSSSSTTKDSAATRCTSAGYTLTSCGAGYRLTNPCPYSNNYYKNCCSEEYAFSKEDCESEGMRASRDSCGGLYKCL